MIPFLSARDAFNVNQRSSLYQMHTRVLTGVIRLLSCLPFRALHGIASVLAFMMARVLRYRRKVVLGNLRRAFPEKQEKEIRKIAISFYHHLADVLVEMIKLRTISEKEFLRRCSMTEESRQLLLAHYERGEHVVGLLGHTGNWEWVPPLVTMNLPYLVVPVYKPLKDPNFDRLLLETRSRFAHELLPKAQVGRALVRYAHDGKPFILGLIADQTPRPEGAQWLTFLSQDTPVNAGPEKLARSRKMPVCFVSLRRLRRGHYMMHLEILSKRPWELKEGELTSRFMARLEDEIRSRPAAWLWSHRRWKYSRSPEASHSTMAR